MTTVKKLILASASPRRKDLLEQIGLTFEIEPSRIEERICADLPPHTVAESLAEQKARAVASRHRDALIIAADTFIVLDGDILGKAHTAQEAREMLARLSGRTHAVITGLVLLDTASGAMASDAVETKVRMKKMSAEGIELYVRSGEPIGKAGAYAIQGLGAVLIEGIEGDYSNVVGLPLGALAEGLRKFGIEVLAGNPAGLSDPVVPD